MRWGILGTGGIARSFASDLRLTDSGVVVAVGSRSQAAADRFADEFGIASRHASYESLVADPDVDVIYVATPHPMHRDNAILALRAGKHVLVEKPFTMNAAEAREVVAVARERGLFAMEAMWTRFLPHVGVIRDWLAQRPARRRRHRDRRPRPVVRRGRRVPAVRARAGRRRAARPGRVPGVVRVDGARHAEPDRVDQRPGVHRRRRADVDAVRLRQRRPGRAHLHAAGEEPDPGRDRRHRRQDRGRRRLLRSRRRDAHPQRRATRSASSRSTRAAACAIRPTRSPAGWPPGELESPLMPLDETISIMETMDTVLAQAQAWPHA